jgi:hypothetical protein
MIVASQYLIWQRCRNSTAARHKAGVTCIVGNANHDSTRVPDSRRFWASTGKAEIRRVVRAASRLSPAALPTRLARSPRASISGQQSKVSRRKSLILLAVAAAAVIYCLAVIIAAPSKEGFCAEANRALPTGTGRPAVEAFLNAKCADWAWYPEEQRYRGAVRNVGRFDIFRHDLLIKIRADASGSVDTITVEDVPRGL